MKANMSEDHICGTLSDTLTFGIYNIKIGVFPKYYFGIPNRAPDLGLAMPKLKAMANRNLRQTLRFNLSYTADYA